MPNTFMYKSVRDMSGKWIINEVCTCGCLITRHENSEAVSGLAPGHGNCTDCDCGQFTWHGFVFADKP